MQPERLDGLLGNQPSRHHHLVAYSRTILPSIGREEAGVVRWLPTRNCWPDIAE